MATSEGQKRPQKKQAPKLTPPLPCLVSILISQGFPGQDICYDKRAPSSFWGVWLVRAPYLAHKLIPGTFFVVVG